MEIFFEIILTGIGAGLFAGMFGIGGGIVIIPALVLGLEWSLTMAVGTSLGALLLPTNSYALRRYRKNDLLYIKGSLIISLGMIFGSAVGAYVILGSASDIIRQLFGVFQMAMGIKYTQILFTLKQQYYKRKGISLQEIPENETRVPQTIPFYQYLLTGVLSGITAGMFGIGGGVIITTALISILKVDAKKAVAISLGAMFLPVGIGGVLQYYSKESIDVQASILIAIGIEIGSAFTSRIAVRMDTAIFQKFFGVALIVIGVYFLVAKF